MSRILLFLILIPVTCRLNAQVTLRGSLENASSRDVHQLSLESWNADHWQQSQTLFLDPDFTFSLENVLLDPGQYRIRIWGKSAAWNDFIVADSAMADTALVFHLDYDYMDGGPAKITGSPANDLYFNLLSAQQKINRLKDSSTETELATLDAAQSELNHQCLAVSARYRKTLIGDVALLLFQPRKSDYEGKESVKKMTANEFAKAYELGMMPFNHDNILLHNAFLKRLNRYSNLFARDSAGSQAFIDGVMASRNGNDKVDGFLFRYLLDKMMDFKQEEGLTYLLKWYAPDCTDEAPLPNSIQNLVVALKTCAPGNIAPDIELQDTGGREVDLGEICAQNKLTLMLFWRSTCSHCKEFEPVLEKIYEKYHPLGVEVYALSMDQYEDDWKEDLKKHPTPWINTFIPLERRKEISLLYPAPSTPTLIALDQKRRVASRVILRSALATYLDSELQKLEGR